MKKRQELLKNRLVDSWKNACRSMGKRLVHHGIAKGANKDKGKGLLTL